MDPRLMRLYFLYSTPENKVDEWWKQCRDNFVGAREKATMLPKLKGLILSTVAILDLVSLSCTSSAC